MEKTELVQGRDNKLTIKKLGINLEIQPYWLVKGMINQNSQDILDELIETKYKEVLGIFSSWQSAVNLGIKNHEDGVLIFEKNKYEIHNQEIQDVADISRYLLPLHSDHECIELTEEEEHAREIAYSYWKYNGFYGFKKLV